MVEVEEKKEKVIEQLRTVYDPEIALDIYELGLIYDISFEEASSTWNPEGKSQGSKCKVLMTLTSAFCPVAEEIPVWVKEAVLKAEGIVDCEVEVTFDPPWGKENITEAGRLELGIV